MYIILTVACFLLAFQVNANRLSLDDSSLNNPCGDRSGSFFHPHPTDPHKYIQCDGAGKYFVQTCPGDLVWDALITACNFASSASPAGSSSGGGSQPPSSGGLQPPTSGGLQPPPDGSSETPSSGGSETPSGGSAETSGESAETSTPGSAETSGESSESSSGGSSQPSSGGSSPIQIAFPNPVTDSTSTKGSLPFAPGSSSSSSSSSSSLCKPKNPCGDHGECIESPASSSNKRRRFACICEGGWFGRLCNSQDSSLSTPKTRMHQDKLKSINRMEPMSHLNKRMTILESDEEMD